MKTSLEDGNTGSGGPVSAAELLEREAEFAAIEGLIARTLDAGQLLAIEGAAGIGKTSLIAEAKTRAQEAGMQVLSARGSELERAFSYGVVRQLFEPVLGRAPADERAELLAGAAALAAPLFDPAELVSETGGDVSLATLHGLYWLTTNVAARGPLLLAVDDLHWCDAASLRWLAYLAARMEDLPLALVVALRPAEPGTDPLILGQIVSDPLARIIQPAELTSEATGRLIRAMLSPEAEESFCLACHEESGGNPLLLRELLSALASEGLTATAANLERLRELEADAVSRAVSLRLIRLPPEATSLAQAVAILGDDADPRHAAALADLGEEAASQAAAELVRADILRPHAPLAFVHPVVRAAVYARITPAEQESEHAEAARLLADSGAGAERVAAHLLRVAPGADARVVLTLHEAARVALGRGAAESAVAYLRRALEEPPSRSERADVLLELGSAEMLVSGPAAVEYLREAHELIGDPIRRAEVAALLGRQLFFVQNANESVEVFRRGLEELDDADSEISRLLEAGLINIAIMEPALYGLALERLDRIRNRDADSTVGAKMLLALLAYHDARANVSADIAVVLGRRALADGELLAAENGGGPFVDATMVLAMADLDEAFEIHDEALADAYRRGSLFALAAAKIFRAQTLLYRGELTEAEAEAREAVDPREAWGIGVAPAWVRGYLAEALIEQGRLDAAGAVLATAAPSAAALGAGHSHWFYESKARFRMLCGDLEQGVADMVEAGRRFETVGGRNPAFMAWRSHAALGLLQLGERQEEARRLAAEELELARIWGAPRALGRALRVAGLVAGGREGVGLLREAVEVVEGSPARLELAKALTELGAGLRRGNRRSEARDVLRRARELATLCGAMPLAQHAETELLATGARPRRIALSGVDSLTPSERRVARMAADGLTNREIAQELFVTQKTVEVHLSSAYRKLEIGSRTQLASKLAEPAHAG